MILSSPFRALAHGGKELQFEDKTGQTEGEGAAHYRLCHLLIVANRLGQVSLVRASGGRVKLTSGKTAPWPMVRPKPQDTGLGARPKTRSSGLEMARSV